MWHSPFNLAILHPSLVTCPFQKLKSLCSLLSNISKRYPEHSCPVLVLLHCSFLSIWPFAHRSLDPRGFLQYQPSDSQYNRVQSMAAKDHQGSQRQFFLSWHISCQPELSHMPFSRSVTTIGNSITHLVFPGLGSLTHEQNTIPVSKKKKKCIWIRVRVNLEVGN